MMDTTNRFQAFPSHLSLLLQVLVIPKILQHRIYPPLIIHDHTMYGSICVHLLIHNYIRHIYIERDRDTADVNAIIK